MRFRINILAFVVGTGVLQRQAELPELVWIWGVLGLFIVTQFLKGMNNTITHEVLQDSISYEAYFNLTKEIVKSTNPPEM